MNKPTAFLGCAFAFTFLACTAASITPGAGTSSSTCDPDTCNPGFECIDNGKGTRAYCRKPCKGKAECAADEICYAPANVELVPYCVLDRNVDAGEIDASDGGLKPLDASNDADGAPKPIDASKDADATPPFCAALNNVSFADAKCDTCMAGNCCSEVTICFGSLTSGCTAIFSCLTDCNGSKKCEDDCKAKVSPTDLDQLNGVIQCHQSKCGKSCPASPI